MGLPAQSSGGGRSGTWKGEGPWAWPAPSGVSLPTAGILRGPQPAPSLFVGAEATQVFSMGYVLGLRPGLGQADVGTSLLSQEPGLTSADLGPFPYTVGIQRNAEGCGRRGGGRAREGGPGGRSRSPGPKALSSARAHAGPQTCALLTPQSVFGLQTGTPAASVRRWASSGLAGCTLSPLSLTPALCRLTGRVGAGPARGT